MILGLSAADAVLTSARTSTGKSNFMMAVPKGCRSRDAINDVQTNPTCHQLLLPVDEIEGHSGRLVANGANPAGRELSWKIIGQCLVRFHRKCAIVDPEA